MSGNSVSKITGTKVISMPINLQAQLEHKEERWMYLTELKEKIDAQGK